MNLGIYSGNIGRDAELGSNNGDVVANFPLAVNIGTIKNKETQWIDCALWGKRAESLSQWLKTGTKVTVVGRQRVDTYTKKDGSVGYKVVLNIIEVDLHGSKPADEAAPARAPAKTVAALDDDYPF